MRLFYTLVGAITLAFALIGFHHFYFAGLSYPGRPITPPIRGLVIVHGVVMAAWLALFLTQPLLIALGKRKAHMALGRVGAVLALAVIGVGFLIAVQSARVSPPDFRLWGLPAKQFMAVPFFAAVFFAIFMGLGLWYRRRLEIHRPMMVLATFAVLSAGMSRIDALNSLYMGTWWERAFGPFLMTQVLCGFVFLARWAITRTFDRWFALGYVGLTLGCWGVMAIAPTAAWERFATMLTG